MVPNWGFSIPSILYSLRFPTFICLFYLNFWPFFFSPSFFFLFLDERIKHFTLGIISQDVILTVTNFRMHSWDLFLNKENQLAVVVQPAALPQTQGERNSGQVEASEAPSAQPSSSIELAQFEIPLRIPLSSSAALPLTPIISQRGSQEGLSSGTKGLHKKDTVKGATQLPLSSSKEGTKGDRREETKQNDASESSEGIQTSIWELFIEAATFEPFLAQVSSNLVGVRQVIKRSSFTRSLVSQHASPKV